MIFFKFIIQIFLIYFLIIFNTNASVYDFSCERKSVYKKNTNIINSILKKKMFFRIDTLKNKGFLGIYSSSVKINKNDGKIYLSFDVSNDDENIFKINVKFNPYYISKDNITETSPLSVYLDLNKFKSQGIVKLDKWGQEWFEKIGDATYECDNWNAKKFKEYFEKDFFNKNDNIY